MLSPHDRSQIAKAFASVRQDGEQSIIIRRRIYGEELPPEGLELTLSSIKVRIARLSAGSAATSKGEGSEVTRQKCLVVADIEADIQNRLFHTPKVSLSNRSNSGM